MSYSNFKDPVGLLKRMILSGNKTAYSILFREFFTKLLIPVDLLLKNSERRKLKKSKDSSLPIILILGGSRSGTTLLYQTLERYLPVSYISNFIAAFVNSPISAYKLFHRLIPKPNKNYRSYFGSVQGFGGPNDAFFLWNRWLGEDRNHAPEDIDEQSKVEMRNFVDTWLNTTKKPFLNKNNRNSLCAPMFDKIFRNIFFVEIYRDPVFVAQSIILSRRTVQGSDKIAWGLLSKDSKNNTDPLAYIDDICHQVFEVNRILAKNRAKIDPKKYFRVSYEDFCKNPGDVIKLVSEKALHQKIQSTELEHLQFSISSNTKRLNNEEFSRIENCIEKLYTKFEKDDHQHDQKKNTIVIAPSSRLHSRHSVVE